VKLTFNLDDFDYNLPEQLIAQKPATPRDHSRLLVYNRSDQSISDDHFYNLRNYLPANTTLVANNSKVEKCRLLFNNGTREIFIINRLNDKHVEALVRPGRKFRAGDTVQITEGVNVEVTAVAEDGIRTLALSHPPDHPVYHPFRATPFPPYIRQDESLSELYQTVYASSEGSKAAPTAGLHFTDRLIRELRESGFGWEEVTLHVGLGTFVPVKVTDPDKHQMHHEWFEVDQATAARLDCAGHITAVGTTSVRVLETMRSFGNSFRPFRGETDIFIRPGFPFKAVNAMITNFHLPKSTLLMLVAAFTGLDEMKKIYDHAIQQSYRFYSFGDGMLIL
jgi:S-adenosylmethionine:tRNA ribosyltransferase-isomerase